MRKWLRRLFRDRLAMSPEWRADLDRRESRVEFHGVEWNWAYLQQQDANRQTSE